MLKYLIALIKLLMPPFDSGDNEDGKELYDVLSEDKHTRRWRWIVFGWLVVLTLVLALFVPFTLTKLPFVSNYVPGFALAAETDRKIDKAVSPMRKELAEQRVILDSVARQLNDQLANSVATEIRLLISKRCKEPDPAERDRLWREKDRKQDEYKSLRSYRYDEPRCGDL